MAKVRTDCVNHHTFSQVLLACGIVKLFSFFLSHELSVLAFTLGDTKQVVLCGVEKAEILHVFPMQNPVTCMHWMEVMEESRYARGSIR